MTISIRNTKYYTYPVKAVYKDELPIGCIVPFGKDLIYTVNENLNSMRSAFLFNDSELIFTLRAINTYRKAFGYHTLYIDALMWGVVNLRPDSFWENLGFKKDTVSHLLYLND